MAVHNLGINVELMQPGLSQFRPALSPKIYSDRPAAQSFSILKQLKVLQ